MKKLLTLTLLAVAAFSAEGYKVLNKIKVGGTGGRARLSVDPVTQRIFASHGGIVEVVDIKAGKVVGQITQLHGVHGIAVASDVGKGFISNGQSGSVTIFDLKTLEKTGEPAVGGQNPDAICYEPKTQRIFTMNGRSNDSTAINAKNNEIVATFPIGEKPENCVVDGTGKVYVNIEDSSEIVEIDAAKPVVTRRASLAPCEGPSGLAIDVKEKKLFSVCGNKMMAVTDIATMKVIATPALLIVLAMVVGWYLGGPDRESRRVLATSTSMRSVVICFYVARYWFPGTGVYLAPLVYLSLMVPINAVFTAYEKWGPRRSRAARA